MNYFRARKRRGLSSIVGTLFFIAIMVAAFTAILAAFSYQNDLIDTQRTIAELEIAKSQENFIVKGELEVASVTCSPTLPYNGCLKVTVYNKGTNPVEVDQLWLIQKAAPYDATPYNQGSSPPLMFQNLIVPISTSKDITSNSIEIDVNRLYSIKVVSKLGTIVTADVPDTCPQCQQGEEGLQCWDLNANGVGDDPLAPPIIINGVTYDTEDTDGDGFFTAIDCQGNSGTGQIPPLDDELLNRPEIFMIFPSPYGETTDTATGIWGVTIANPSENTMGVNKIVITTLIPTQSGQNVFPSGTTLGDWTTGGNQLTWKSPIAGGTPILSRQAMSFFVTPTASTSNTEILNGIPVFASVLTDYGQFGKTSYLTSMIGSGGNVKEPIVNVYLSDTDPNSITDIDGTLTFNAGQTLDPLYFTLSERSTFSPTSHIDTGANLIVNVPKGFVVSNPQGLGNFDIFQIDNPDSSTQVIATLKSPQTIGSVDTAEAKSFSLSIKAPSLVGETEDALMVLYVLAEGTVTYEGGTNYQLGPIDEVVIRVIHP